MKKKSTFTLKISLVVFEAEMLVKALDGYQPKNKREDDSKQDLTRLIIRQINEAKELTEGTT